MNPQNLKSNFCKVTKTVISWAWDSVLVFRIAVTAKTYFIPASRPDPSSIDSGPLFMESGSVKFGGVLLLPNICLGLS